MRTLVICSLVALLATLGCEKKKPSAGDTAATGSGGSAGATATAGSAQVAAGSAQAPAVPAGTVEIFIDDASVAKVAPAQIEKWPRLDTLVPEGSRRLGTWAKLKLTGAKTEEVPRPSSTYPDMVPALFPGEGGKPSFGIFDAVELAKKGKPGLRADDVREIRISISTERRPGDHQGGTGEGGDPTKIVIEIEAPSGKSQLTGAQIIALPRETMPGTEETHGWRLQQLLDLAGIKKFEQIVLRDAGGTTVIVDRKDKTVPFIKLNKQGSLRFRVLKQAGTGWKTEGELRSLVGIKVSK